MRRQILFALAAASILVKCRGKRDKIYWQILEILFYMVCFSGIFYFARKATIFLHGDFASGRNYLIWICLLAASVLYFPQFEKTADLKSLCRNYLETGLHLFVFFMVALMGFCTQSMEEIPPLLASLLICAALLFMPVLRHKSGGQNAGL